MDKKIKVMGDLKVSINENVKVWNDAYKARNLDAMLKADTAISENVSEYAAIAQALCFHQLKETGNPMLEAVKRLEFSVLAAKDEKNAEAGTVTKTVVTKSKQIDLLKLDKYCEGGIAKDDLWMYKVERFNQLMCLRAARELKIDAKAIEDSYYMSEKAKEIDMGGTPDSNTKILAVLADCISAIIYKEGEKGNIYKPSSKDVAYLLSVYTKKGKTALTIATAKHSAMRGFIMEICHRIVLNKEYSLDYKKGKEKAEGEAGNVEVESK